MTDVKKQKLEKLKAKMMNDDALPLKKGANNLVFADGNEQAEIMFIGEGPGYWEDMKALPFVGNAGAFLNQLIRIAGLEREDVFITNVIHHRPPENRDPSPEEIDAYKPYLDEMIKIIDPNVIVTLGRFSMAKFLPGARISLAHGKSKVVEWKSKKIVIIPMYHPAAGLRNGSVKEATIADFKILPQIVKESKNLDQDVKEKKPDIKQMSLV